MISAAETAGPGLAIPFILAIVGGLLVLVFAALGVAFHRYTKTHVVTPLKQVPALVVEVERQGTAIDGLVTTTGAIEERQIDVAGKVQFLEEDRQPNSGSSGRDQQDRNERITNAIAAHLGLDVSDLLATDSPAGHH
jgi:hypothetical protein